MWEIAHKDKDGRERVLPLAFFTFLEARAALDTANRLADSSRVSGMAVEMAADEYAHSEEAIGMNASAAYDAFFAGASWLAKHAGVLRGDAATAPRFYLRRRITHEGQVPVCRMKDSR